MKPQEITLALSEVWKNLGELINDETGKDNPDVDLLETARNNIDDAAAMLERFVLITHNTNTQ